jgi:hypothetical protein
VSLARLVSVPALAVLGLVATAPSLTACFPAAIDLKPVCDFGVQISAAYNLEPTNGAALLWQPSPSCARPTGLSVTP